MHRRALLIVITLFSVGCGGRALMPTPRIYTTPAAYPEETVPTALRTSETEVLYFTDRAVDPESEALAYGAGRSESVAFGTVTVDLAEGDDWSQLRAASSSSDRETDYEPRMMTPVEIARFAPTPRPFLVEDGKIVDTPEVAATDRRIARQFLDELESRIDRSGTNEVLLYVHGFNNSFEETAITTAELWHFLGRSGVPILYTWPAASGGLFGYFVDRESGEFTVFHLKEMIELIAASPSVDRINVIAHSRGTDVTTTALRELVIAHRAAGHDPRTSLRIENLVLAAPDLDLGVVRQRLMAERFGPAFGRITIYTTQSDMALGVSQALMEGTRFGRVLAGDFADVDREIFAETGNVDFVNVAGVESFLGHSYFRTNPGVSSDLISIFREGAPAGSSARPLETQGGNFWRMPPDYTPLAQPSD